MKIRSTTPLCALVLSIAACAAAQSAPPATSQDAKVPAYSAISSTTTLDGQGAVASTTCCTLTEVDSAGRRRTAHIESASFDAKVHMASIHDPVGLTIASVNYDGHKASVTHYPPTAASKMVPSDQPFSADNVERSDLGDKTIDGIQVHGYGWTTADPTPATGGVAGATATTAAGFNPATYPVVHEWWWSPELRLFTLITDVDGRGNTRIQKYEKIERKEPNPSDFLVPAGFDVTNATVQSNTP